MSTVTYVASSGHRRLADAINEALQKMQNCEVWQACITIAEGLYWTGTFPPAGTKLVFHPGLPVARLMRESNFGITINLFADHKSYEYYLSHNEPADC